MKRTIGLQREWCKVDGFEVELRRRPFQRSMRLRVLTGGILRISCGLRTPQTVISRFVQESASFIEKQLQHLNSLQEKFPPKQYLPGETFPFLGVDKQLRIEAASGRPKAAIERDALVIRGGQTTPKDRRDLIQKFYRSCGKTYLTSRVGFFSDQMGLKPNKLSFRSQSSRWGSCSSTGNISLNWRLMAAPAAVLDYVVIHELAHLRHYNHSPAFWALVAEFSPHFKPLKQWLSQNQWALDFLSQE